jgi:tryptophan halogenase
LVYDHSKPNIGVGESLTPIIYDYLGYVGLSREDLIKNVNATVKLGLKFKNWLNDGSEFLNTFSENFQQPSMYNFGTGYGISHDQYDYDETYGKYYFDNNKIPIDPSATQSLHIDASLFSKFIEQKFKDRINVVDDTVVDVIKNSNNEIVDLKLKKQDSVQADFFIDASGFESALFKNLSAEWVDKKDWLPIDRCIPNPLPYEFNTQPPYTISESSSQGWILQVPLSNRWGTGYLYSSQFISDDNAFINFDNFLLKNYDSKLSNTSKVLKFKSGYWKKQWIGNCICVGLSSGFAEPLEATNIHHTIYQLFLFLELFNFKIFRHDVNLYNRTMNAFYENIYNYLRFCYTTKRTDSEFWKYMTYNTPEEILDLEEKIKYDIIPDRAIANPLIFTDKNFIKVAYGLKKIDKASYIKNLHQRFAYDQAKEESFIFNQNKINNQTNSVDHRRFIETVLKNQN